jgi:type II secretory pathway predicted ATPase ExeA
VVINPYSPGDRPQVFVGRRAERTRLRDRLARVSAYGEMMGPLTVVTGPRGVGKTSLLHDVADQATQDGFVVCWTVGLKRKPFLGELLGQVARAVARTDAAAAPATRRRLAELGVQFNVGLVKVDAKVASDTPDQDPFDSGSVGQVEEFLGQTASLVRSGGGAGLLVVVDELHAPLEPTNATDQSPDPAATTDAAVLLNAIQDMAAEKERFPLGVVGAGLPQTKALLTRVATFAERTREIILPKLDGATSRALLTEPAKRLGVTWTDEALDWAVQQGDGYPQSLQIIGEAAWDTANPAEGGEITLAHAKAAELAVLAEFDSMFQTRWQAATDAEKRFLRAMASHGTDTVTRSAVARTLGLDTTSLSMARQALIAKGVIEAPAYGQLRFTVPDFSRFVSAQNGIPTH